MINDTDRYLTFFYFGRDSHNTEIIFFFKLLQRFYNTLRALFRWTAIYLATYVHHRIARNYHIVFESNSTNLKGGFMINMYLLFIKNQFVILKNLSQRHFVSKSLHQGALTLKCCRKHTWATLSISLQ